MDLMASVTMTFSSKLRGLLKERGWTQGNLAELLETSQSQVSDWMRDKTLPSIPSGLKLARILGVTMDFLFDDTIVELPKPELTSEERTLLAVIRRLGTEEVIVRLTTGAAGSGWVPAGPTQGSGKPPTGQPGGPETAPASE